MAQNRVRFKGHKILSQVGKLHINQFKGSISTIWALIKILKGSISAIWALIKILKGSIGTIWVLIKKLEVYSFVSYNLLISTTLIGELKFRTAQVSKIHYRLPILNK
jgi:hypothetical protein